MVMVMVQSSVSSASCGGTFRRQLESIILHNHEDTMSKTGAILHCGIVAAGERDVEELAFYSAYYLAKYDAFEIGFITTDDFTDADILGATYPAVAKRLYNDWVNGPAIPIVTGLLGKGWKSGAVTTLSRGGSDLTATSIGRALGLQEIQLRILILV
ncbi:unnamed protein product, partial [Vitis vinifera]|uniref:Aspartokinase 1, chloroplastic n=1 Tax=Vitis vinifera TaxID=29760 RepID=D7U519_VITVI